MKRSISRGLSPLGLTLALLTCAAACGQGSTPSGSAGAPSASGAARPATSAEVLAKVNGAPITQLDVDIRLAADNHENAAPTPEHKKTVLDTLVTREILAQKALAQGLDADPRYQDGLRKLEAQVAAFKRQELSELLLRKEGEKRSTPTDEDARAYFQKNEKQLRTQVHVLQILRRSENAIVEVRSQIDRGTSFEDAAKGLFPGLPEGQRPWDLGYLSFSKVPEQWRATVYDLKPGEMSGVLRGPNERYWLIKLVDTREDTAMTFESVKDTLLADLKLNKMQRSREDLEKELRQGADVVMVASPK